MGRGLEQAPRARRHHAAVIVGGVGSIYGAMVGAVIVVTYNWARAVWARTALQLAAEEERRRHVAQRQRRGLLDDFGDDDGEQGREKT